MTEASCANHSGWQVRATTAKAIRNLDGNANQPPALAPITPTAATEPVGTTCGLCGKKFKKQLTDINLRQHQGSTACKPIASQSSQAELVTGVPDTPISPPSSTQLASAHNSEEDSEVASRAAVATELKKRLQKKAEKDRRKKKDKNEKEAKRLTAEVERADLEFKREACLDELRQRAKLDPSLLDAICEQDKACNDGACILMHHCTRVAPRWECQKLVRGAPSNSSAPGHSARQLRCDDCTESHRATDKKYRDSLTKEEKKDRENKRNRDGGKQPGTANPVAVLKGEFLRLKTIIEKQYDWTLLADPCRKRCFDVEFASTCIDDTAP